VPVRAPATIKHWISSPCSLREPSQHCVQAHSPTRSPSSAFPMILSCLRQSAHRTKLVVTQHVLAPSSMALQLAAALANRAATASLPLRRPDFSAPEYRPVRLERARAAMSTARQPAQAFPQAVHAGPLSTLRAFHAVPRLAATVIIAPGFPRASPAQNTNAL
jgi:hypothetical protein